ncbi:hypothetical protein [Chryseobacterium sp.]|uniref:hypothetical protein n=1 Tax=Chryseobacterium sp. TaxID=1871047 RepID=UPI0028A2B626|nr:hypothetical protein [Chryseobacterium sp.]
MKTKLLLVFLLWAGLVYGQINRLTDEENQMLQNLITKQEGKEHILGYAKMKDSITIYQPISNRIVYKEKIDTIKVDIKDGMIEKVLIITKKNIYYNHKAPIPLIYDFVKRSDYLFDREEKEYIRFSEAIDFHFDERFSTLPDNKVLILSGDSKKNIGVLTRNTNLKSFVNFVAYSDFLGLLGDEPNALVHFEANAKFYLHRNNIFNRFMYIFPVFQPSFSYNKLDSKFEVVSIMSNELNPTEIFRRHNYSVGLDITLFKFDFLPNNSLDVNASYQYVSGKILLPDLTTNTVNAVSHLKSCEATLKSKLAKNFGIDLSGKYIWQTLNPTEYYERSQNNLLAFRGSIYYYPPSGNNGDKVFIRFTNYLALNNRADDFSQFQIGFSKSLNFNSK